MWKGRERERKMQREEEEWGKEVRKINSSGVIYKERGRGENILWERERKKEEKEEREMKREEEEWDK